MKGNKGFTLVELVIVIIIVGILAIVSVGIYSYQMERAKATEAVSNLKNIEDSIINYYLQNRSFPENFNFKDLDIILEGDELSDGRISSKNFTYKLQNLGNNSLRINIDRNPGRWYFQETIYTSRSPFYVNVQVGSGSSPNLVSRQIAAQYQKKYTNRNIYV